MRRRLQTQISLTVSLVVLITISLISFLSNWIINLEFDQYIKQKQEFRSEEIAANLIHQYDTRTHSWNVSFVHGIGMYALYDGYIIKLYDTEGGVVWDAENHDMSLCSQMMSEISQLMQVRRPDVDGHITSTDYPLTQDGREIGTLKIVYYGPYFLNESDFRFLDTLNLLLFLVGIASFGCSLVAGFFLARRISRPVSEAARAAREISEGNYSVRFERKNDTKELEELARSVNHLAEKLGNQEILRKKLTSDVAHELRTPLTAVASHLEAMIEGVWEASKDRLQSCYEEVGRISGLVADLERLSTAESENLKLNRQPVDLFKLAEAAGKHMEAETAKKQILLRVAGESSTVSADPDRLNQVLINLISNAVKYTPEKGHILVAVKDGKTDGTIAVEDDGIGMAEEELPYIFERFYRTDKSRSRATGGAGIGLSIAKAIVTAHGGKITAQSEVNHGSIFTVSIPKQ